MLDDNKKHLRMLFDAVTEYKKTHPNHNILVNISDEPTFSSVRNCICIIDYIRGQNVFAIVDDLTGNQGLKNVEIPLKEFSPADRNSLSPGTLFMWMFGYLKNKKSSAIKIGERCFWSFF